MTTRGTNPSDTAARRQATFAILNDYIKARVRQTRRSPPLANQRRKEYTNAHRSTPDLGAPARGYIDSLEFREETLARFITSDSLEQYRKTPAYEKLSAKPNAGAK